MSSKRSKENRGSGGQENSRSHRLQRVEREIRQIVGTHLIVGFKGDVDGIISVTRVIVSADLRTAKVFVTLMGSDTSRKNAVSELQAHASEFQHEVNRQMRMKYCPRITFIYDDGFDNVLKVENILRTLAEERSKMPADENS